MRRTIVCSYSVGKDKEPSLVRVLTLHQEWIRIVSTVVEVAHVAREGFANNKYQISFRLGTLGVLVILLLHRSTTLKLSSKLAIL